MNYRILHIVNNDNFRIFTGFNESNEFCIKISKLTLKNWKYAVCDFINYNNKRNYESVIISSEKDLIEALTMQEYCIKTQFRLRHYEPEILIHSTTLENWEKILIDNSTLYSWKYLKETERIKEEMPIGNLLGDPKEYSDYIMLGDRDSLGGEYVVMSKQAGFIKCNDSDEYQAGVRIYLNAHKLIEDSKLLRDGIHFKVYKSIELKKYMIDAVKSSEFGGRIFTPIEFIKECNQLFELRNRE